MGAAGAVGATGGIADAAVGSGDSLLGSAALSAISSRRDVAASNLFISLVSSAVGIFESRVSILMGFERNVVEERNSMEGRHIPLYQSCQIMHLPIVSSHGCLGIEGMLLVFCCKGGFDAVELLSTGVKNGQILVDEFLGWMFRWSR